MFRRHHRRRSNILFVMFRLVLSVVMFAALLGGIYSAYKHFSGLDPFKLDPRAVVLGIMAQNKNINEVVDKIPGFRLHSEQGSRKLDNQTSNFQPQNPISNLPTSKPVFSFLLIADSHNDNVNLRKALTQSKDKDPKFIVGMGDYTDVGTLDELRAAKKEFDSSSLRYFLVVGDHDLWDCRNRSLPPNCNFRQVFGPSYQSFSYDNFRFIILYNSDNYLGMDQEQLDWLSSELNRAKNDQVKGIYVFAHEPLYHPSSDHVMGRVESQLKQQAKTLIHTLKDAGVKEVFYGDIHYFTSYIEPETNLSMVTVGAITSDRNPQAPRYGVVSVFEDGKVEVEDVEIK